MSEKQKRYVQDCGVISLSSHSADD